MHIKHESTLGNTAFGWTPFPYVDDYVFDIAKVKDHWARLHAGDAEPLPSDPHVLAAWALFHSGEFQQAYEAGLALGLAGVNVANKAACVYANYLEANESNKINLFMGVVERAEKLMQIDANNVNAHFAQAYALGRYGQSISVAKALAQGLGGRVKQALETVISMAPNHADAYIALGAFHAEVIDKVGVLIGNMTYGVKKETSFKLFQQALVINPASIIALIEHANAMVILDGEKRFVEATQLYEAAAASTALDVAERLQIDLAIAELAD